MGEIQEIKMADVQRPITEAPSEVQEVIRQVLTAEKNKLDHKNPRHINDDIIKIIKEVVNEVNFH